MIKLVPTTSESPIGWNSRKMRMPKRGGGTVAIEKNVQGGFAIKISKFTVAPIKWIPMNTTVR